MKQAWRLGRALKCWKLDDELNITLFFFFFLNVHKYDLNEIQAVLCVDEKTLTVLKADRLLKHLLKSFMQ